MTVPGQHPRGRPPASVAACLTAWRDGGAPDRATTKAAVRAVTDELATRAPGRSVELRVPPFAAVQIVAGTTHRRGTPPALVQIAPRDLLELAVGDLTWGDAMAAGRVRASGERSDLSGYLPLFDWEKGLG